MKKRLFLLIIVFVLGIFTISCEESEVLNEPLKKELLEKPITVKFNDEKLTFKYVNDLFEFIGSDEYISYTEKIKKSKYASVSCEPIMEQPSTGFILVECCYSSGADPTYHLIQI